MILEKDVKVLKGISDTQYKLVLGIFIAFTLFQLFIAYNNFNLAIGYGQAMGLDFKGIFAMWNAEPELQKQYVGYEVQSVYRLNMTIISFGVALFFAISAVSMSINAAMR